VAAGVLLAAAAAALHRSALPLGAGAARPLEVAGSEHPVRVLQAVWEWLAALPQLGVEAAILAIVAGSLTLVARTSDLTVAAFAAAVVASTLIAAPEAPAASLVVTGWVTYAALVVMSRRLPERTLERRKVGAALRQTRARLVDRMKAAGGPRWPQRQTRFRQAGAR
jgi:hypothetical protein